MVIRILQHLFYSTGENVSHLDDSLSYEDRQKVVDEFKVNPARGVFGSRQPAVRPLRSKTPRAVEPGIDNENAQVSASICAQAW